MTDKEKALHVLALLVSGQRFDTITMLIQKSAKIPIESLMPMGRTPLVKDMFNIFESFVMTARGCVKELNKLEALAKAEEEKAK